MIGRPRRRRRSVRPPRGEAAALAAVAAGGAALAAWAMWFEPRRLVIRDERLELPTWPGERDGLRVAVISDLHAGAPQVDERRVRRVVALVNAQRPDLVVLLGDFIDPKV